MKNGISMEDCRFYVNEEKRAVVCVIPDTKDRLLDFILENFRFNEIELFWALTGKFKTELELPKSFMGKAVCSTDDEWDEKKGRILAYARAKDKYYKCFFKRANMLVNAIDRRLGDMIEVFNSFGSRLEDNHSKLEAKIKEMIE